METDIANMLNNSLKLVGLKQVSKGLSEGIIRCVIVSKDTDKFIKNKIVAEAEDNNVGVLWFSSKQKLGQLCNIDVAAAVVGLVKQEKI